MNTALLNKDDLRHALTNAVFEAAWWENRDSLDMRQILKLALRPQWR